MKCLYCGEKIDGSFGRTKYIPRGSDGICHSCIDRHWGGISNYNKAHRQKVKWVVVEK